MPSFVTTCQIPPFRANLNFSMPTTYPGDIETSGRNVSPLKVVGEVTDVAAAGVEVPVHCLSCPAVTSNLGIWGESAGP